MPAKAGDWRSTFGASAHDEGFEEMVRLGGEIRRQDREAALQTEAYFSERRARADREAFLRILNREGGEEPEPEDVLPEGVDDGRS
jgi:hypothetical protein